jgi:hypothetical protein
MTTSLRTRERHIGTCGRLNNGRGNGDNYLRERRGTPKPTFDVGRPKVKLIYWAGFVGPHLGRGPPAYGEYLVRMRPQRSRVGLGRRLSVVLPAGAR